ncbi:hypothetical protein [Pantoea phage Nafs113]|nr:hypothetical protein [Pantoea phage Nafs113]
MKKFIAVLLPVALLSGCVIEQQQQPPAEVGQAIAVGAVQKDDAGLCHTVGYAWGMSHTAPSMQTRQMYADVLAITKQEVAERRLYADPVCQQAMVSGKGKATSENQQRYAAVQQQTQQAERQQRAKAYVAARQQGPSGSFSAPIRYSAK